jgi:superfamily II DNA or RNA helicase
MAERRRFSQREKNVLYVTADGLCQCPGCEACSPDGCEAGLEPGWHADHVQPHSRRGETDIANGQAMCPPCNLRKGNRVRYTDDFRPRPFQREVINSVLDGMASGRRTTVVLASPGSGKTLAYQAAATYAYRDGRADLIAAFVPRIILARQCETSWMRRREDGSLAGNHALFDAHSRVGKIRHVPNQPPLTGPGETGVGFVATYSALVTAGLIYDSWARQHRGQFLLIADEAQFCGAGNDEHLGGTRAGALITELAEMAAHTLLLTGTPYRSDNQRLILADYSEPDENGRRQLLRHAEATYSTGVTEGYLRRFEATMHDARIRWKQVDNTVTEYDLSASGADLAEVLRKPEVWQPIADGVVEAVREKQRINPKYRGLISCMEMQEARQVDAYLRGRYPGLRVLKATTEEGPAAEDALREFRDVGGDVLVTVRKAFIGYDCPEVTVVGILTHYRDWGHLEQLVGRGLRTWAGTAPRSQSCRVIAPDDPKMTEFIEYMRGESENGLRERERREREDLGGDRSPGESPELGYVETAHLTTARVVSNDASLDNEQRILIESIKHDVGSVEDVTVLARFAEQLGLRLPQQTISDEPAPADDQDAVQLTDEQQIGKICGQVADEVRRYLSSQGIYADRSDYGQHVQQVTSQINRLAGDVLGRSRPVRGPACRTVDEAQARLQAVRSLREQVA